MTKRVRKGFSQRLGWYFHIFLSTESDNLSTHVKMLQEECHAGIKELEEIAFNPLIVYEL